MSVKFGDRVMQARKEKELSREELAEKICTSGPIVGRYERGDMMPSVEIVTKIAEALDVSLDFLVGNSSLLVKDKNILARIEDIAKLPSGKRSELFNVLDAYLRDYKTGKAYAG
jgi:ribosome-binding protein aMBF1 (putative translation factor)